MYRGISVLLFCFVLHTLLGNNAAYVKYFSKENYKGYSKNWSITHNDDGVVYIGNDAGLLRFNGIDWQLYHLPHNKTVRSVKIGVDGKIYTGSYEEFGYWQADQAGQLSYVSLSDSLCGFSFNNEEIWKIVDDSKGNILFQSFSMIFKYDGQSVEPIKLKESIIFLLEARNKMIAQTLNKGLVEYRDGKEVLIPGSELFQGANVKVFLPFGDNKYLLGERDRGLFIWDDTGFREWQCPARKLLLNKEIDNGIFDGQYYYLGTHRDGIFVVDQAGHVISHLNTENRLNSNTIYCLDIDQSGRLWVGQNKGLCYVEFNYPFSFITRNDNPIGFVHTAAYYNECLYLGTNQGVFMAMVQDEDFEALSLDDFHLVQGTLGQTWELKVIDNQLLCGHTNGTYRLEGNKAVKLSDYNGSMVFQKVKDKEKELVVQSTFNTLVLLDKDAQGQWKFSAEVPGFNNVVSSIENDFYENLWICHFQKKGIFKMRMHDIHEGPAFIMAYGKDKGLPDDFGNGVYNVDNKIVFATGKGFYAYEPLRDTIFNYEQLNRQLGNFADSKKVVKGFDETYWFIKSPSVALYKKENLNFRQVIQYAFNYGGEFG